MNKDDFWVGARQDSGAMWLYDPSLKHDNSDMIYAYHVDRKEMREYQKDYVKKMLSTVANASRDAAIQSYLEWYKKYGNGYVEADRRRKEIELEDRRKRAIEKHKEYLIKFGKHYSGITQNSDKTHRVTHCYACKDNLDSSLHIECNSCNWLICYCGACGCGFKKMGHI